MSVGLSIHQISRKISKTVIEKYKNLPVANISDAMQRLTGVSGSYMPPRHRGGALIGIALTVKVPAGDNLFLQKAIDMAGPGDVIVVDGEGYTDRALMGELMLAHAAYRGIAGFVINGAIRDLKNISSQEIPVYAVGISHRGPYKNGPGEINVSVSIQEMVINPGDLVLGDQDGIVCVSPDDCESVYNAAAAKHEKEERQLINIHEGKNDRRWIDKALRNLGIEV